MHFYAFSTHNCTVYHWFITCVFGLDFRGTGSRNMATSLRQNLGLGWRFTTRATNLDCTPLIVLI